MNFLNKNTNRSNNNLNLDKQFQVYNDAMQIKNEIEKHNAGVKELTLLHKKLEKNSGQKFSYDKVRYLSDYEKLKDVNALQQQELLAQTEQQDINSKLSHYYDQLNDKNINYIKNLNEKITDRNQIININQHAYEIKDLYSFILASLVIVMLALVILTLAFSFGAITRRTFVLSAVIGIIAYLIYIFYWLIKVRYFRDPYFTIYKHAIDPTIKVQNCGPCQGEDVDVKGSTFVCPGKSG